MFFTDTPVALKACFHTLDAFYVWIQLQMNILSLIRFSNFQLNLPLAFLNWPQGAVLYTNMPI